MSSDGTTIDAGWPFRSGWLMQGLPFNNWTLPDLGESSRPEREEARNRYVLGPHRRWDANSNSATGQVGFILFAAGFAYGAFMNLRCFDAFRFSHDYAELSAFGMMLWLALVVTLVFSIWYRVSKFGAAVALSIGIILWAMADWDDYVLAAPVFSAIGAVLVALGSWLGSLIRKIRRQGDMMRRKMRLETCEDGREES